MGTFLKRAIWLLLFLLCLGFFLPENFFLPVKGISRRDYNQNSFWAYPWGKSVTHKGVDIFANKGTPVLASINGIVLRRGTSERAGHFILILGPKWRAHYYAHLNSSMVSEGQYVKPGQQIGTVGNSGNAKGKAPHLHYSIYSVIPLPWKVDQSKLGWKKMFFINPIPYLNQELPRNSSALSSE